MKKTIQKVEEKVEEIAVVKTHINPLSASFGQEDLNKMVDKINEIILHLNSVV